MITRIIIISMLLFTPVLTLCEEKEKKSSINTIIDKYLLPATLTVLGTTIVIIYKVRNDIKKAIDESKEAHTKLQLNSTSTIKKSQGDISDITTLLGKMEDNVTTLATNTKLSSEDKNTLSKIILIDMSRIHIYLNSISGNLIALEGGIEKSTSHIETIEKELKKTAEKPTDIVAETLGAK